MAVASGTSTDELVKCVLVGDGAVGKCCMAVRYTTNAFPEGYVPTVLDNYSKEVALDDRQVNMQLWVTAGQEDYDRLRPMAYPNTDVFMLCFSLMSECSLSNIELKWYPEVRSHDAHVPIVLVGTKLDLRQDKDEVRQLKERKSSPVSYKQGLSVARTIKAKCYIECSSLTQENLHKAFEDTLRAGLKLETSRGGSKSKCVVL